MLKIQAEFTHKPTDFALRDCVIEKIIELPGEDFDYYVAHPYESRGFIAENRDLMYMQGREYHCLLVMGENRNDGILIEAEGYDYARYASFIPGMRAIVEKDMTPTLSQKETSTLKDLLLLGVPENAYLVHDTHDVGFVSAGHLSNLTGKGQDNFEELLNAEVKAIRSGAYGAEIVLTGINAQLLSDFDQAAADFEYAEQQMGM